MARELGIPALVLPTRNTGVREVLELRRALRRSATTALIADRPRDLRLGAWAALGRRIGLIYRYNVSRERPPSDLVTRMAYRRVAMTVFRTDSGARNALATAPFMRRPPHRVITGGVDTGMFIPDPAEGVRFRITAGLGDQPVLLAVGALMPEKRYSDLLHVVAGLGRRVPILICGSGRLEPELRVQAAQLGVDARFLGFLAGAHLRAAYNAATCVIHACMVETFGLSVGEAMACGRPVVAAAGGGVVEVIGEAGILVPPLDREEFTRRVEGLLRDPEECRRLGQAARARSVAMFSVEKMITEYETLLLQLEQSR